jgi:glucose-1-phosphate thymidylyltransferase
MKAIIPVAGYGTRLKPHADIIQKCLLPVAGKPVLEHIIEPLVKYGVNEITLIIGHLGDQIVEWSMTYDSNVQFNFIEQKERLGLGHAIKLGLEENKKPVVIVLGDSIIEMSYKKLFSSTQKNVIGVKEVDDPRRFGIIETEGNKISAFIEKPENPTSNLAITGIYLFKSQLKLSQSIEYLINNDIRTKNEYQLTDALQHMVVGGDKFYYQKIDNWLDCGIPETLLETNSILLSRKRSNSIDKSSKVVNSTVSSSTVSEGCEVVNSTLNNVIMLRDSKVENVELENEIIGVAEVIL